MPNDMTFQQSATLLNAIQQQVTGQASAAPVDLQGFVSVAQTLLKTGYDPVINAINQVLSRTIFSTRPYRRKFGLAEVSESAYGNHVRKISVADQPIEDDDRYKWPVAYDASQTANPLGNGQSVDMYTIKKPDVLQTNFYGQNVWQDHYTIFRDQLDCAFSSPEELSRFIALVTGEMSNKIEQIREDMGRACVINAAGGTLASADAASTQFDLAHRVIPLLTMYNAYTGQSFTVQTVFQPDNFVAFVRWAFGIIQAVSDLMEQRSVKFQTIVNGKMVQRHTPKSEQRLYVASQAANMISTMVRVGNYNDGFMTLPDGIRMESVAFWQNIGAPLYINGACTMIGTDGTPTNVAALENPVPVLAYLHDREALGYATTQSWSAPTPLNARGGYTNIWLHETQRLYNDHSEKTCIFTLA